MSIVRAMAKDGEPGDVQVVLLVKRALGWERQMLVECRDAMLLRRVAGQAMSQHLKLRGKAGRLPHWYRCKRCGERVLGARARDWHTQRHKDADRAEAVALRKAEKEDRKNAGKALNSPAGGKEEGG